MRRKLPERYVQINGDTRGDSRLMWILFFKGGDSLDSLTLWGADTGNCDG